MQPPTLPRRKLLAAMATAAIAGCVSDDDSPETDTQPTDKSPAAGDDGNETVPDSDDDEQTGKGDEQSEDGQTEETEGENSDRSREEEIDRLPDRSPLSNLLVEFFAAADRESFARDREMLVYEDGRIRVRITLEPDGERPEQYLPEETSGYGDTIIAFVEADDLVDLALDENVRQVTLPPQTETHDG